MFFDYYFIIKVFSVKGEQVKLGVKIITDSSCDLSLEEAKELDITIIPLHITIGDDEYLDGVELDSKTFFEKLPTFKEFPKTSQAIPATYEEYFSEATKNGDDVICITLSSDLSGCFQSANIASEDFDGKVYVIDSRTASASIAVLVEYACQLRDSGMSAKEMYETLEAEKGKIRLIALLDTLEYLKKGGRISAAAAFAGELLSIKPVIAVEDGPVHMLGKARGTKNGRNLLTEFIEKKGPVDFDRPHCLIYSGVEATALDEYLDIHKDLYPGDVNAIKKRRIGCAIGSHIGPGAIGVVFFSK